MKNILNYRKIFSVVIILCVIIAGTAGCKLGKKDSDTSSKQEQESTSQEKGDPNETSRDSQQKNGTQKNEEDENRNMREEESIFPLTITDATGCKMVIDKKPQKIISLTLASDEMLFSLVDKSRILAVTAISEDPGISNIADEAKDIEIKLTQSDTEKIIELQPDLVIVPSWAKKEFVQQLRDAKITVYAMETASGVDHLKQIVMKMARLVGENNKGVEITEWINDKLKDVNDRVSGLKDDQKLEVLICDAFWCTYAKGTTSEDILTRAGLVNVATKAGLEGWPQVSKEKIIKWNPDVIFLPSWSYDGKFDPENFKGKIVKDESLKGVNAVKNDRVYLLRDAHMTSTSQYMILGVEDAAKAAYPGLFK